MNQEKRGSVLIVDDELGMRLSLEALLEECFDVKSAASVRQAHEALEATHVDVLLCDYQLPDGTGLELFEWASLKRPPMMAIVISGQADHPELIAAERSEAIVRVLGKPFDPARLVGLVERTVQLVRLRETMKVLGQQQAQYRKAIRRPD